MEFMSNAFSELVRILIGLTAIAALVWICGRMPRTYVSLKVLGLAAWGILSVGIPPFVFFAVYFPARQYALGIVAVAAGAACMIWPFMKFGWPALCDAFKPGATGRP